MSATNAYRLAKLFSSMAYEMTDLHEATSHSHRRRQLGNHRKRWGDRTRRRRRPCRRDRARRRTDPRRLRLSARRIGRAAMGPDGQQRPRLARRRRRVPCAARHVARLPGRAHPLLRRLFPGGDAGRHPADGDPGRRAGLPRLPARLACRHHRVRDRPAQGAGVQDLDAGRARSASRRRAGFRCRSICATTGPPR